MRTSYHPGVPTCGAILIAMAATGCERLPTAPPVGGAAPAEFAQLALESPSTLQQVNLTFEKSIVDPVLGVWEGRVSGDVEGDLRTEIQDVRVTGPIWHVRFLWVIDGDDPSDSLTFEASGTLNTGTGRVVMNGSVVDGWLTGARVHEEGQAQDPLGAEFRGIITIMKETAP